jgi:RNA polymerase sigma-70 factor (ECF subfamily)
MSADDVELVQRCRTGDRAAFDVLVLRYQSPVYNAALRMLGNREDAKDVAQNAFLKAFEHLEDFDPQYRFFSWLYRIALNEALTAMGRRKQHGAITGLEIDGAPGPEATVAGGQTAVAINGALLQLVSEQRQVVILRHVLDLSYEEMAEVLQVPDKTVKSRLHSARQKLRELLINERTR